jgi:5-methylcytosine-specific restriction endonuclease McrA
MSEVLRAEVRRRAGNRCEYCRLPDLVDYLVRFHLEHIRPIQHRGLTELGNLAWSCHRCNEHKGTNLATVDPDTNERVWLFNPREQVWDDHFVLSEGRITGRTAAGRATAWLLDMNVKDRIELRLFLIEHGRY